MSVCGYFGLLLAICFVAIICGFLGTVVGLATRPLVGAVTAALLCGGLVVLGCVALYQITPSPPELPRMKADIGRGLVMAGSIAALTGGAASAGLSYLIASARQRF